MIFKEKDSIDSHLQDMRRRLSGPLPAYRRERLQKELAITLAGLKGEKDAAFYIDFHLKDIANWAVIHDLRLEWKGRVAQMDHLLINRLLEFYVVESKSFRTKVRFANGGWERLTYYNRWEGIPSPSEQNDRHIAVLQEVIRDNRLAPTRLGIPIKASFFNVVVLQPSCSIEGKYPDEILVYRVDSFVKKIRAIDPFALDVLKIIYPETLHQIAGALVAYHKPRVTPPIVDSQTRTEPATTSLSGKCQNCEGPLTVAEAKYCKNNNAKFGGQLLCQKCQRYAPKEIPALKLDAARKQKPSGLETA